MINNKNKQEKKKSNEDGNEPKKPKFSSYWIYIGVVLLFLGIQFFGNSGFGNAKETTPSEFYSFLKNGDVDKVKVFKGERVTEVFLSQSAKEKSVHKDSGSEQILPGASGPDYTFEFGSMENFETKTNDIIKDYDLSTSVKYDTRQNFWGDIFLSLLPFLLIIGVWVFIMRKMSGGQGGNGPGGQLFNIGKSKAKQFDANEDVKTTFKDVAGLEGAKEEVEEIVDFLKKPDKYTNLGAQIPKGALLVGPPGTGKTLLAKAVAGEAGVPFFSISGSDFVEMFVGVGASRVRDLFKKAKEKSPAIIFIDEIDAVGRSRGKGGMSGSNDERENTLNQLLTEMDGFDSDTNVIIIAATNRADVLDKALLRAGRFDRQISVDAPDLSERKEIFEVHLKPIKSVSKELDVEFLAKQTPGFTGADIANLCNEAALVAARHNHEAVGKQDFLDAVDRIIGGLEKRSKIMSEEEKKAIAFHESGHAAVGWLLEYAAPLVKVTIVPRGQSLGAAWYLPEEKYIVRTEQMLDEMCAALGGRASEKVTFDKISTGALSDLEKVTKQARAMVSVYGLNDKVGNLTFHDSSGQQDYNFTKPYSEKTSELIDKEISTIVEAQYQRAIKILEDNKDKLNELANLLLEREVIFKEDMEKIFGKRTFKKSKVAIGEKGTMAKTNGKLVTSLSDDDEEVVDESSSKDDSNKPVNNDETK